MLQKEEVERVDWFDMREVRREIETSRERFCMAEMGLDLLIRFLEERDTRGTGEKERIS